MRNRAAELKAPRPDCPQDVSVTKEGQPVTPTNKDLGILKVEAPTREAEASAFGRCSSLVGPNRNEHLVTDHKDEPHGDWKRETSSASSDIMERARAAIASAERASAAARAAAELVNARASSQPKNDNLFGLHANERGSITHGRS